MKQHVSSETRAAATTPSEIASMAASMFPEGPVLMRLMQRWRPYICPFEKLLVHVPVGSSVLDVGCGGGLFLGLLHQTGRLGRGVGFDASPQAIQVAQKMAARVQTNGGGRVLSFQQQDVVDPWPAGEFDVVSMIDLMHHVAPGAQRRVLVMAAERVGAGGRLLYKDMSTRPRWRALASRAHDLLISRQWIHYAPVTAVEAWADECGLKLVHAARINRLWYGHDLRVFERALH